MYNRSAIKITKRFHARISADTLIALDVYSENIIECPCLLIQVLYEHFFLFVWILLSVVL